MFATLFIACIWLVGFCNCDTNTVTVKLELIISLTYYIFKANLCGDITSLLATVLKLVLIEY